MAELTKMLLLIEQKILYVFFVTETITLLIGLRAKYVYGVIGLITYVFISNWDY